MISVRIVDTPSFKIIGKKTWIGGIDDSAAFGRFYEKCQNDGTQDILARIYKGVPSHVIGSTIFGVSSVETDPSVRTFNFYVATEYAGTDTPQGFEVKGIPAARWAVFSNKGSMPEVLINVEMYAFGEWLPTSGYVHAKAPEIEAYPPHDSQGNNDIGGIHVEFWLPIERAVRSAAI